jgi:hypothetical protein
MFSGTLQRYVGSIGLTMEKDRNLLPIVLCLCSSVCALLFFCLLPTIFIGFHPPSGQGIGPTNRTVLDLLEEEQPSSVTSAAVWFAEQRVLRYVFAVALVVFAWVPQMIQIRDEWKNRASLAVIWCGLLAFAFSLLGLLSIIATA